MSTDLERLEGKVDAIDEAVRDLDKQMSKLTTHIDAEIGNLAKLVTSVTQLVNSIENIVRGTGEHPGLLTRIDRLEQDEKRRAWHIRAVWGAIVTTVVGFFIDRFLKK